MAKTDYAELQAKKQAIADEIAPLQRERHAELQKERDKIHAKAAPVYAELEAHLAEAGKTEAALRDKIKKIKEPLSAIDEELSELTAELKGKTGVAA
jgi:hypothetical protein